MNRIDRQVDESKIECTNRLYEWWFGLCGGWIEGCEEVFLKYLGIGFFSFDSASCSRQVA